MLTGRIVGRVVDKSEKENILRKLVHQLNLEYENVVAIGDGENDLDMMGTAGIGIAWNANLSVQKNVSL